MAAVWKQMAYIVCVTGSLLSLSAHASAMDTVTLKEEAQVKGPQVTLGDVAEVEGENTESLRAVELTPAASPGASKRVDATVVASRLKAAGVKPQDIEIKGSRSVSVTTLHQEVTREMIADQLGHFIESQMPWDAAKTEIHVSLPLQDLLVPQGELWLEWKPDPQYRYVGTGSFRCEATVDGQVKKTFTCKAVIETFDEVVVAAREISRGKALTRDDLKLERRPLSALREAGLRDPSEAVGFMARTAIAPGQIITPRMVTPPSIIKRNQLVTVETRAGGLHVQTQARAESDGAVGDVITCVNLNSRQGFQGIIRED